MVVNDVNNPASASNKVLSETSNSGIYVTGIVNQRVTCILLDTGASVSILNEGTWRKSAPVTKIVPVTRTLTTANGNELTVLGETNVRFLACRKHCLFLASVKNHYSSFGSYP